MAKQVIRQSQVNYFTGSHLHINFIDGVSSSCSLLRPGVTLLKQRSHHSVLCGVNTCLCTEKNIFLYPNGQVYCILRLVIRSVRMRLKPTSALGKAVQKPHFSFEFKNGNFPSYCDNEEVCERVDSRLHEPTKQHRYQRVLTQLAERSLPNPKVLSSNPVIGKI